MESAPPAVRHLKVWRKSMNLLGGCYGSIRELEAHLILSERLRFVSAAAGEPLSNAAARPEQCPSLVNCIPSQSPRRIAGCPSSATLAS